MHLIFLKTQPNSNLPIQFTGINIERECIYAIDIGNKYCIHITTKYYIRHQKKQKQSINQPMETINKQYGNKSNGNKLQELCDSYCQQIQFILLCLKNNNNSKIKLCKKILQLILALYAPRYGSSEQSLLNIPKQEMVVHNMINNHINELVDYDKKVNDSKNNHTMNYLRGT